MGEVLFPLRKNIICAQRIEWTDHSRDNRGTALRNTIDYRLRSKDGSRLGAHTSLDRTRKGSIGLLAGIVMVGRDGMFIAIRGV